jgi:hypothetical protein
MSRRRSEPQKSNVSAFVALALAALVATTGGAMHAIFRNGQIKTEHKIAEARKRIEEHRLDIQMIEVRMERLMDRYEIREQLEIAGSPLEPVVHHVVERIDAAPSDVMPVAVRP